MGIHPTDPYERAAVVKNALLVVVVVRQLNETC